MESLNIAPEIICTLGSFGEVENMPVNTTFVSTANGNTLVTFGNNHTDTDYILQNIALKDNGYIVTRCSNLGHALQIINILNNLNYCPEGLQPTMLKKTKLIDNFIIYIYIYI